MNRNNLWQYLGNNMLENQPNTNQYAIGKDISSYIPNQEFVQNILTEKQTLEPSVNPKTKVGLREKLSNALLGRQEAPTEYVDLSGIDTNSPEFLENTGGIVDVSISKNPKVGGLLPDIAAGYRENSASPLELNNLQTNITPDGRNKGAAYRFGEFAGTAARLLDNPLVRGGIAYGLSKSMGDRRPLVEGLTAAVGTQQNRMKDQLYRNALEEQGVDTSKIRGYLGDDTFKNYSLANYRNRNLDVKMHLGMLSDNTKRAQLINTMLNTGELDPVQAMELMNEYGLNVNQLDTSNQTKLVPYKQYAYKNGWNLGWANYGIKADKAAQEKEINDTVIKTLESMGVKNNSTNNQPNNKKGKVF